MTCTNLYDNSRGKTCADLGLSAEDQCSFCSDQPSQRAMNAAKLIARSDKLRPLVFGGILRETAAADFAATIDAEFPAYLEIREALERLTGLIRDCHNVYQQEFATYLMRQESFKLAEAALAKARKD